MRGLLAVVVAVLLLPRAARADSSDFPPTGPQSTGIGNARGQNGGGQNPPAAPGGNSDFARGASDTPGTGGGDFGNNEFIRTNPNVNMDQGGDAAGDGEAKTDGSNAAGQNGDGSGGTDSKRKTAAIVVEKRNGEAEPDSVGGDDSLKDVRENFETVVEAYVAKRSAKGYWTYQEKGGKPRRLKSLAFASAALKKAGPHRYAGAGTLRDARTGRRLTFDFVVDFSGDWKVVSVKPRSGKPAPPR